MTVLNVIEPEPAPNIRPSQPSFRKGVGRAVILGAFIAFYQWYNMFENPPCVSWGVFDDACEPRSREDMYPTILLVYGAGFAFVYAGYQFLRRRRAFAAGVVLGVVLSGVMFWFATMIPWFFDLG